MDDQKHRLADLRENQRFRDFSLGITRNESEVSAEEQKRWRISDTVPVTPEPDYHQSRDYEKSPTLHASPELDRMDSPSFEIKASFHEVMATATDAWIQSHARSKSAMLHDITTVDASNADCRPHPRSRRARKKRSVAFKKHQPHLEDVVQQRDSDDPLSLEYEHESNLLLLPIPGPKSPREDTLNFVNSSDDLSMDSMKACTELNIAGYDDNDSTIDYDSPTAVLSSIVSLESHADTIDSEKEEPLVQTQTRSTYQISPSFSSTAIKKALEGLDGVFVKDKLYSWIPAKVLDYQQDHAIVAVDLPDAWYEMTDLESGIVDEEAHSSMNSVALEARKHYTSKFGVPLQDLRKVTFSDYEEYELPMQNQEEGKRDMADLIELHFPAILYNLKARHHQRKPYTRVGDIIVAMNPCLWIEELYNPKTRDLYSNNLIWGDRDKHEIEISGISEKKTYYDKLGFEPHVYEISALAYRGLATTGKDQAILVTGESGAGKTETVKIVMNHLATVQQTRPEGLPTEHCTAKEIVARVLKSSPVFEAFGNAKTVRNDNSSRFGKFTQLQFQLEPFYVAEMAGREIPYTDLVGSKCTTYLLEKSRVASHDEGERSFHIFYQLLASSTEFKRSLWPALAYRTARHYSYTAGEVGSVVVDAAAWKDTIAALRIFHFRDESLEVLLRAIVVVLQLGNLIFDRDPAKPDEDSAVIQSEAELVELSQLMGIDKEILRENLTSRALKTPGGYEDIKVKMLPQNAKESCDALAKEIYAKIFDVLVQKINKCTAFPETLLDNDVKCGHVSLLDIFGFERFATNRFEQLCINYANERLHNKYIVDNFNEVKEEYAAEGVDLYDFKLVDNSEIISLLEGKPGLLAALDEECVRPKGNADAFVYKAKIAHKQSSKLIDDKLHRKWEFAIQHFAGPVEYNAENFLTRNTDKLPEGLVECAAKSHNSLIGDAFKVLLSENEIKTPESNQTRKKSTNGTVLQKFQGQLRNLMTAMQGTKTRYIRCIKPNPDMIPGKTNHKSTIQQLECSGLITALTISRESFPNKLSYEFIQKRYACIMKGDEPSEETRLETKVEKMLLTSLQPLIKFSRNGNRMMPFVCGTTKVFFKAGAQDLLEQLRIQHYESAAIKVQATVRKIHSSRQVESKKACIRLIQSFARMANVLCRLTKQRAAATKLTSWMRGRRAYILRTDMKKARAATTIQSYTRGQHIRREFLLKIAAARIIQKEMRRFRHSAILRAELKSLKQQALMSNQVIKSLKQACVGSEVIPQANNVTSQKIDNNVQSQKIIRADRSRKLFSEFHEMYGHLREEIKSLRSENDELRNKLSSSDVERKRLEIEAHRTDSMASTFQRHIKGFIKANDSLGTEVQAARLEASKATRKLHTIQTELESKLSIANNELEHVKKMHRVRLDELENEVKESQAHNQLLQRRLEEILLRKEKHETERRKLEDELTATKKSHKDQMTKLIDILDKGQCKREDEVVKLTAELLAIRKAKDGQISRLQQEVKALQASKEGVPRNIRAALEPRSLQNQLSNEAELRSRRVAEFDDLYQSLQLLITESSVLPRYLSEREMQTVVAQQERGQKMYEMLQSLSHIFKKEEASQHRTSETALCLVEQYVALTEPNRTVLNLNDRLAEADLKICRLLEELRDKEYCKRCAVRDSATQRRRHFMGSSTE